MQIKLTNEEKIVTTEQKPQSREHNSSNVYQEGSMWYFYDAFIFVISDVFPFFEIDFDLFCVFCYLPSYMSEWRQQRCNQHGTSVCRSSQFPLFIIHEQSN